MSNRLLLGNCGQLVRLKNEIEQSENEVQQKVSILRPLIEFIRKLQRFPLQKSFERSEISNYFFYARFQACKIRLCVYYRIFYST